MTTWTRKNGSHCYNALATSANEFPGQIPDGDMDSYTVMIEKLDGKNWVVFAEDHEPEELEGFLKLDGKDHPNCFRTLTDAKIAAEEWAIGFKEAQHEYWATECPQSQPLECYIQNGREFWRTAELPTLPNVEFDSEGVVECAKVLKAAGWWPERSIPSVDEVDAFPTFARVSGFRIPAWVHNPAETLIPALGL